jgi:MFS family permease
MLSLDVMSEKYHALAANYIFLMVYSTLESIFVNTLLYRVTPQLSIVVIYRAVVYVSTALTMHIAAYISRKTGPVFVVRLGGALYLLMYVALFFGMDNMGFFMYPTAFLSGTGAAFYWVGHNMLIPEYTTPGNRDIGVSILGIIQGVATLAVPVVTGGVISFTEAVFASPETGYRVMFGAGMLTAAAQVRYQRRLPKVAAQRPKSRIGLAARLILKRAALRCAMAAEFLRGFRDGAFAFMLSMVLFEIATSESLVGINAFLTGALSIAGAWAYGRLVTPRLRPRYVALATVFMSAFCALLFWNASVAAIMVFAMINAFFALFVINASSNACIDVLTSTPLYRSVLGETLSFREGFLALGRVAGLAAIMLFPDTTRGHVTAMLLLSSSQFLTAALVWLGSRVRTGESH